MYAYVYICYMLINIYLPCVDTFMLFYLPNVLCFYKSGDLKDCLYVNKLL